MQKKLIALIILTLSFKFSKTQTRLLINGESNYFPNGTKIVIKKRIPFNSALFYEKFSDTTTVQNKKFQFNIQTSTSELYILSILKKENSIWTRIFLQPGKAKITINDSVLSNFFIENNGAGLEYKLFEKQLLLTDENDLVLSKKGVYLEALKNDSSKAESLRQEISNIKDSLMANAALQWIITHPKSQISSYLWYDFVRKQIPENVSQKIYPTLSISAKKNTWGQEFKYLITKLAVGKTPPDFIQSDTSGNNITLSTFSGKYVLLDFWASWCGPCRKTTPELIDIYNQFKTKNFTIISISLDENRKKWIGAINQDKMNWVNISDLQFWKNKIAVDYNITKIPSNILLNEKGVIIAKDIWGDDLKKKLSSSLK